MDYWKFTSNEFAKYSDCMVSITIINSPPPKNDPIFILTILVWPASVHAHAGCHKDIIINIHKIKVQEPILASQTPPSTPATDILP